jgi:hypothetical protein
MKDIGAVVFILALFALFAPEKIGKSAAAIRDAYAMPVCEGKI